METVTENEEDDNEQTTSISIPVDIISVILTRLPTKPLLQFKSVSKQWHSLISSPSFIKHHSITNNNTPPSLLIVAYDTSTRHRHLLSFPLPNPRATSRADATATATHLMTLTEVPPVRCDSTETEHLHGLVLLTSGNGFVGHDFAFVINPSTRKCVKLSPPRLVSVYSYGKVHICYFFGYDESRNEHKVLNIRMLYGMGRPSSVEIFLFELSSFEWRKIDAEIPVDISRETWDESAKRSVCVNSVIHLVLARKNKILAFDLRTEIFEIIKMPNDALSCEDCSFYVTDSFNSFKFNCPILMKVNGFLGVLGHDQVLGTNEMDIWMLKDYEEERVWVKETIVFGQWWTDLDAPFPLECFNVNEIAFVPKRVSKNMIRVPVYDMKTRRFKSVKYYLGGHFLRSRTVVFHQVRSYVQSILPLERNAASTS